MKTTYFNKFRPVMGKGMASAIPLTLLFSLSSCNKEDPSYEKEALRLTAEKAALETRLKESDRKTEALQMKLNQAQSAVSNASEKISEAKGKIDVAKIKLEFAKAVSDLGDQIEKKHPDYDVESVTFQKMKLPTDYPFSSGVMTTLVSKSSGKKQNLYWEAQGNTQGVWRFANKKKPTNTVANNPSVTPTPKVTANKPTATPSPAPKQPARPPRPTRVPARTDANTHIIDWGTLR